jgi:hypothetical protein
MKIRFSKANTGKYAAELIMVMIGVFLGILASDWNTDNNHKKLREVILNNIVSELALNKDRLQYLIDYHDTMADVLDTLCARSDKTVLFSSFFQGGGFGRIPQWKGTGISTMRTSTYESTLISELMISNF